MQEHSTSAQVKVDGMPRVEGVCVSAAILSSILLIGWGDYCFARRAISYDARPSSANCTWRSMEQLLDHFSTAPPGPKNEKKTLTYSQRFCVYDGFYDGSGVVLFYTGNESPVEVYINVSYFLRRASV